jgi:hypothetical protein
LAVLSGASNFTLRLLATDIASSLGKLFAAEFAGRLLALRLADSGAGRGVALPLAVREARALGAAAYLLEASSIGESDVLSNNRCHEEGEDQKDSHCSDTE